MELYLAGADKFGKEEVKQYMKLYLAGMEESCVDQGKIQFDKLKDFIKPGKLFIDSGAFSAWTKGAEINAIREAGKKLGTYDLTGCELYATGYPCPMCLSAIIWSNIKKVYYCNDVKMAKRIGFRDDFIYDFIKNREQGNLSGAFSPLHIQGLQMDEGKQLYENYTQLNKIIY